MLLYHLKRLLITSRALQLALAATLALAFFPDRSDSSLGWATRRVGDAVDAVLPSWSPLAPAGRGAKTNLDRIAQEISAPRPSPGLLQEADRTGHKVLDATGTGADMATGMMKTAGDANQKVARPLVDSLGQAIDSFLGPGPTAPTAGGGAAASPRTSLDRVLGPP